jgi:hypothetical protein
LVENKPRGVGSIEPAVSTLLAPPWTMSIHSSSMALGRDRDEREARRELRKAYAEDEQSDSAARGMLVIIGQPCAINRTDAATALATSVGRDLVGLAHRAVSSGTALSGR